MLSFKTLVYREEWLNLVFANRNQSYGAYQLRRGYSATLAKAMGVSVALFAGAIIGAYLYTQVKEDVTDVATPVDHLFDPTVVMMAPKLPREKSLPTKAPAALPDAKPAKMKQFSGLVVVHDVPPEVVMPTMAELSDAEPGPETNTGEAGKSAGTGIDGQPGIGDGAGAGTSPAEEAIFMVAEKGPEFPGGQEALGNFIRKNLRYPARASEAGIGGRVTLSFVIERDGRVSDIKVIKGLGYGCDEEAVRIMKKVPAWIPGEQNGRKVRVQCVVPLLFTLQD